MAAYIALSATFRNPNQTVSLPSGLPVSGVILTDQVKGLDWHARNTEMICTLPSKAVSELLHKLGLLLSK